MPPSDIGGCCGRRENGKIQRLIVDFSHLLGYNSVEGCEVPSQFSIGRESVGKNLLDIDNKIIYH